MRDTGDASPRFIRMTLNYVPCSRVLQKTSQMPLAAIIQPFALQRPGEDPLPVPPSHSPRRMCSIKPCAHLGSYRKTSAKAVGLP